MGSLGTTLYLVTLRAEENTLLRRLVLLLLRHWIGSSTLIADGRVDSKCAIDVTASLIELNSLPGILSCGWNWLVFVDPRSPWCLRLLLILLWIDLDISFDVILSKSQRQIEFKWIVLATLRLLKSLVIRCCGPWPTLGGPSWIRRVIIVRGPIGGGSCSRGEEACLGASLVGCCIHLVFDVSWLSDGICQLDNEIIIQMVFIWRLGLFSNPWSYYLSFAPVRSPWVGGGRWNSWWRCILKAVICFVFNCLSVSPSFWNFRATFSLLSLRRAHLNCLGFRGFLLIYLHSLIQFLLNHFSPRWWLDVLQSDRCWLFGGPLWMQPLTLLVVVTLVGWKCLSHVIVSLVFLVNEVVSGCDMVVSVSF